MTEGMPKRIQRKRTKGWKMPAGAISVTRPGKWGNPFSVKEYGLKLALFNYRQRIRNMVLIGADFSAIRGKDLACWCPLDQPCHVDILLEVANAPEKWRMRNMTERVVKQRLCGEMRWGFDAFEMFFTFANESSAREAAATWPDEDLLTIGGLPIADLPRADDKKGAK
jgi:hypothetical protein